MAVMKCRNPREILAALVTSALLFLADACLAQEIQKPPELLAAYQRLSSYCDAGTESDERFERCADASGRFKESRLTDNYWKNRYITWSDGELIYSLHAIEDSGVQRTTFYGESPLAFQYAGQGQEVFLVFVLQKFFPHERSQQALIASLNSFVPQPELSNAQFIVLERREIHNYESLVTWHLLWVSREDGLIRKYEGTNPYLPPRVVSLEYVDTKRILSHDDLWHGAAFLDRYSMHSHTMSFAAGLGALAFAIGCALWSVLALTSEPRLIDRIRARLWRAYKVIVAAIVVSLVALTVVSIGGGGHPPPIIIALVAGPYAAIGLVLAACLIFSSYIAEAMTRYMRKRFSRGRSES